MSLDQSNAEPAKTILYLCYGAGSHVEETIFSLLTAFRFLPPGTAGYRYVVYTDNPAHFADLDVLIRPLGQPELDHWLGGLDYIHRRKTMTIIDALQRFPGDLAFVDCDTYFRKSPATLFKHIGPGRSCLHVLEARLLESRTEVDKVLSDLIEQEDFFDTTGSKLSISPNAPMWNSGVVGVNSADIGLMREVLEVSDQMWRKLKVHHIEQFLAGYFLSRNVLSECADTVFHYWPGYIRQPFREKLSGVLSHDVAQPLPIRARRAFANRPRTSPMRWTTVRARSVLRQMGFNVSGMMKSA